MKKYITLNQLTGLIFFLSILQIASGADNREESFSEYTPRFGLSISEALGYNLIQTGFNYYILDAPYAEISLDTVVDNLSSPWVWDSDTFLVNHFGHPYQGSVYFSASRSNHLNFYESTLVTALGSVTWEYFMENERQSINDLIVTTTGGAALGEILFRLSEAIWYENDSWSSKVLSIMTSPMAAINRSLFKEKVSTLKKTPIHGEVKISADLLTAYAEYGSISVDSSEYIPGIDDLNMGIHTSLELEYGNPYKGNFEKPFEYFNFDFSLGMINDGFMMQLFTEGLLKGANIYLEDENAVERMGGLFLGLDFLYVSDSINLAANTIGLGYFNRSIIDNKAELSIRFFLNFIFLGGSDFAELKYYDSLSEPDEERRNYSLGIGENFKVKINLEQSDFGAISLDYMIYGIHILNDTVEDEASDGFDLTGLLRFSVEKNITENWRLGTSFIMYHKNGFYDSSSDISEFYPGFSIYGTRVF